MEHLSQLQEIFHNLPIEAALKQTVELFSPGTVKLSSSLGQEDQVLTDIIGRNKIGVNIFTLDTGRLFYETYETLEKTEARYKIKIEVFFPQPEAVQTMVNQKGINLFYESVENRQTCCGVRKVEPLNRALQMSG
jgi:phosphoadenosine phosphosulfate reductase